MKIKDLSEQVNISSHTLRYYEKIGLLVPNRLENNYRDYTQDHVFIIKLITVLQHISFDLDSIKDIIQAWYATPSEECNRRVNGLLYDKTKELKNTIEQYKKMLVLLDSIPKPSSTEEYQANQKEIEAGVVSIINDVYSNIEKEI
jgi:DNA-binding transcriptional MerR regulator